MREGRQVVEYKNERVLPHYVGLDGVLRSKTTGAPLKCRCVECDAYIGAGRIGKRALCRQCYYHVTSELNKARRPRLPQP
jgi:hypothetical protein